MAQYDSISIIVLSWKSSAASESPNAAPIRSVTVNGKPWSRFNPDKEVIELKGLTGKAVVVAKY